MCVWLFETLHKHRSMMKTSVMESFTKKTVLKLIKLNSQACQLWIPRWWSTRQITSCARVLVRDFQICLLWWYYTFDSDKTREHINRIFVTNDLEPTSR